MFPGSFTYSRPATVPEAVALLAGNPDAKIIAGGHSLIPAMKIRLAQPGELVDLRAIRDLKGIEVSDKSVTIRAMSTYNEIRGNADLASALPILVEAINVVGDAQVRAHGTLAGSLVHNDPAADLTAVALALGGDVHATGQEGDRSISIDDFFVDLWTTALAPEEVVTQVVLRRPATGARMAYRKFAHPASGYAIVGVAAVTELDGETVTAARIALTGVSSTAVRLAAVEDALVGSTLDEATVNKAVAGSAAGVEINGDRFAPEAYRANLIEVLTKRALLGTQE